jgi:hypothetical protein
MLATLAFALVAAQDPIPGKNASLLLYSYMPGQREVVLGMGKAYPDTRMQVIFQTDKQAHFPAGGGTITPGGLTELDLGYVRWSVKEDTFAGKKCKVLRGEGHLKEKLSKTLEVTIHDTVAYWVDEEGKILRQYNEHIRPYYKRIANCVFQKDSIDVTVEDEKGRRATSVFPNIEMDELHAQFKPMMVDGKMAVEEKTYYVYDPFKGSFEKYTARLSGWAGGTYFKMKFVGKAFEIAGPRLKQTVAISQEGDMIQVVLPKERFIVMQNLPPGKGG